jgi:putative transposase
MVISDQHAGLVAALRRVFQGSSHQHCRVHFRRNVLAHVPKAETEMVAAVIRLIGAVLPDIRLAGTSGESRRLLDVVSEEADARTYGRQ